MRLRLLLTLFCAIVISTVPAAPTLRADGWVEYSSYAGTPYTVSYTNRSLTLNGAAVLFLSGSIHYARSEPSEWPHLFREARRAGLNMVQLYTHWNAHQPTGPDAWLWSGRLNVTHFIEEAAAAGLFVTLRVGPYICAEWNNGGLPLWLHYIEGMTLRSYNPLFRAAMESYVDRIVALTRSLFADRGGPIVLFQIENELSTKADPRYIQWCGNMAHAYELHVPIVMCNGASASNTINSCNAEDCTDFIERHGQNGRVLIDSPALWTETAGHFQVWGQAADAPTFDRPPSALSFSLLRWLARGGSHLNYYVFFGGNNFGTSYGDSVTTAYANGALLRSDGLPNEPKRSHLARLHRVLASIAGELLSRPAQLGLNRSVEYFNYQTGQWEIGTQQTVFVYGEVAVMESTAAVTVLVRYSGVEYLMAPQSALILQAESPMPLFNSSDVQPATVERVFEPYLSSPLVWRSWAEPLPAFNDSLLAVMDAAPQPPIYSSPTPLEQLFLTRDRTEYLFYHTAFTLQSPLEAGTILSLDSSNAQSIQVWVDGVVAGQSYNVQHEWSNYKATLHIFLPALPAGHHRLTVLSTSLGISNGCNPEDDYTSKTKGVRFHGHVILGGLNLTQPEAGWQHRPFLLGQWLNVTSANGISAVPWSTALPRGQALVWYTANFSTPRAPSCARQQGYQALVVQTTGLTRGHLFVNALDVGRYWMISAGSGEEPTQQYYQVPWSWLVEEGSATANVLTLIEEMGADDVNRLRLWTTCMAALSAESAVATVGT